MTEISKQQEVDLSVDEAAKAFAALFAMQIEEKYKCKKKTNVPRKQ